MTPEGRIKEQVKDLLKAYEAYWHCPVQNGMGAPSLDFVGCSKGRYFTVETKAEGKGMTPRQELTATAIKKAGGKVFLINETSGMDELKEWIINEYQETN